MSERRSREILVVEDEWLVRMELAEAFHALGFVVLESATAEHGAHLLHDHPGIALLVTDIRLAGAADGWELALEARAINPAIPVIYLSANAPAADRIVADSLFIEKPALMETVTAAALHMLGGGD